MFSYMLNAMKVYKAFDKFILKEMPGICNMNKDDGCAIEVCPDMSSKNKIITTYLVYGPQAKHYMLTKIPAPKLKE